MYEICRVEGLSEEKSLEIAKINIRDIKNSTKSPLRLILNCIRQFLRAKVELQGTKSESASRFLVSKDSDLLTELKEYIFENL